jgi:uncharacterized protein with NAD-binding domain and iron-sulfur cluster
VGGKNPSGKAALPLPDGNLEEAAMHAFESTESKRN